ncbi:excalibur calcium-binding domain-containing protein [Staphylococcus sp. MI 10-1553]|nr:excalibur calcium-binding domain-containing protein [Staphylococcus sp. MI 10-1553]
MRTVYPNDVPEGHPAYQTKFDRDSDDFACERN